MRLYSNTISTAGSEFRVWAVKETAELENVLAICGPTGAGKSTMSSLLEQRKKFGVIRNTTTRSRRASDKSRHFKFVDSDYLVDEVNNDKVSILRIGGDVVYSYRDVDVDQVRSRGRAGILMFRSSGLEMITRQLSYMPAVVIVPPCEMAASMSKDEYEEDLETSIRIQMKKNERLVSIRESMGLKTMVLKNNYLGDEDLDRMVNMIDYFYETE